ncbi:MAG: recombinase family protein [Rhodopirellula sp.]|nr:recombinase family protein [Rhodopirellula sp.]
MSGQTTKNRSASSRRSKTDTVVDRTTESGATNDAAEDSGRLVGYARVSTSSQELRLQVDALKNGGVDAKLIFTDKLSGATSERPGLDACLKELRDGDTLLVWRLDRLGRSVRHLVTLVEDLRERGVGFRSLCDGAIDTTTASGELVFNIFSSLAQFERRLIAERTKAGLAAARARGRFGGRPRIMPDDPRVVTAKALHRDQTMEIRDICQSLKISRATLYRFLKL